KSSFGPNWIRLTNMLTTVHAARCFARRISWMWPAWRLPMVGTKTLSGSRCSRSRRSLTEVTMSTARPRSCVLRWGSFRPGLRAHRDAALGEKSYRVGELRAALELHHLCASRHQFGRTAERLLRRFLIASEGHVGDEEAALAAARDAARVVGHVGKRHRQRGVVPLQHHAERVADEEAVETRGVQHRGEARVVAGEHGYLHAIFAQLLQRLDGQSRHPSLPS